MAWTTYKGLTVPDSTSQDGGTNLLNDLKALADRTSGTAGSVLFVGASGFATEDNANFFFDDTNNRLGIGTAPGTIVHLKAATPVLTFEDSNGRFLTVAGPTGSNARIEVSNTGAGLDLKTSSGAVSFVTSSVTRAVVTGDGTYTTLAVSGSLSTALATKTANYTLTANDSVVRGDATGGAFNLTLPTAVGCAGRQYLLKKIDSSGNAVTVGTTSSQTIDGAATYPLSAQYAHVILVSDGANWMVF